MDAGNRTASASVVVRDNRTVPQVALTVGIIVISLLALVALPNNPRDEGDQVDDADKRVCEGAGNRPGVEQLRAAGCASVAEGVMME